MKVIPGELKHRLVVTDLVKKKVKKVVRKKGIERRKVWKLKEDDTRARFEGRVGELVSADALDLHLTQAHFSDVCKGRKHAAVCCLEGNEPFQAPFCGCF